MGHGGILVRNLIIAAVAAGALFASTGLVLASDAAPAATTTTTTTTVSTPAPAAAAPADQGKPVAANTGRNEIVCHSMPAPTGTRFGGRNICKTAGQWADEQAQAQHDLEKQQVQITTTMHGN
jgi:hypothetical protein